MRIGLLVFEEGIEEVSMSSFPRGSEWRKWDLHFHTPGSGGDYKYAGATNKEIVDTLVRANVSVVAATDHHFIDIPRIREMQSLASGRLTVLPGIELRTELGGSARVHMIGIFPETSDIENIWTKLSAGLEITPADVKAKGEDRVYVDFREAAKLIRSLGGLVSVHAGDKQNSIETIKGRELYKQQQKTDLLRECVDILEVGKAEEIDDYERIVFPAIGFRRPIAVFSDSHDIRSYSSDEVTWIKADPTFDGLKQILNESIDRVYVGNLPPALERISERSTRVMTSVKIIKCAGAVIAEKWFDCQLQLNSELVAIIGNKGNGKSAIADIIALAGSTARYQNFSFLRPDRFRDPKANKAKSFEVTLTWADGSVDGPISLDQNPESTNVEKIKYIPQYYLETICNEISLGKGSRFYKELQAVIYSHIPESERLGYNNLEDLLEYLSSETEKTITTLVSEVDEINKRIVACEEKLTDRHRKVVTAQLSEKRRELAAHEATKPSPVKKPEDDPSIGETNKKIGEELVKKQEELKNASEKIDEVNTRINDANKKRATAERLLTRLTNIERQVTTFREESADDLAEIGLQIQDVLAFEAKSGVIEKKIKKFIEDANNSSSELIVDKAGTLANKKSIVEKEISTLASKLTEPQKVYHAYLDSLKKWEETRTNIIGIKSTVGTITYYEAQIELIDVLPAYLKKQKRLLSRKIYEIYLEKRKLQDNYSKYHKAVQDFLSTHPLALDKDFKLTFTVSVVETGFAEHFLQFIDQRKIGSFSGVEEGARLLKTIIDRINFNSPLDTLLFIRRIITMLKNDSRSGRNEAIDVHDQLASNSAVIDVYNYITSLQYLNPIYNICWDNKRIEQLSPGERGNILLIFYLLVDQNDVPLVIDQPEENLDNQTIYKTLVPCIKDAKKRRQIVMVTHNPNLAVVCDAEQIVCAEIKKEDLNKVVYETGAIEDRKINKKIVDVLEGTRPAFDKRDSKYHRGSV